MSRPPATLKAAIFLIAVAASAAGAQQPAASGRRAYTDPSQLEVPWPAHSHYRQPWRAFLETRSGHDFLRGIGINYNAPTHHGLAVRLLAESGFTTFRIEIGWGNVNWEETALNDAGGWRALLSLCREYGLRPTLLLNAHHGVPCPVRFFHRRLTADAQPGARLVRLDDVGGIVPGRSGLSNLTDYIAAEVFITAIDAASGACRLSKPLPRALRQGDQVLLATLRHLPAHPVGTPEFEQTAAGWERYVQLVLDLAREAGLADFDIEIWNELSFGSRFMSTWGINHYYDPPRVEMTKDFLRPGGHAWEIARRTLERVKQQAPGARCIWGFSNTTFFHCPIEELPPGMDGQSYHPYGTGVRRLPEQEQYRDMPERNLEGFTPALEIRMPEGWAHTYIQTESLMRLLNPDARRRRPEGVERFFHYMTEHGVAPPECGVADEAGCWQLKAKCALRSFCLWMNKGIDALHYYCAYGEQATGMGLLPVRLRELPADTGWDEAATLPLRAVRNLTRAFAGSRPLEATASLRVEIGAPRERGVVFAGDATHPPLTHADVFAVLPWQLDARRFLIALYVMTYDVRRPMEEERYRLTIHGLPGRVAECGLYDPLADRLLEVAMLHNEPGRVELEAPVVDCPRLLALEI